jgi:hypothetical protein
MNEPRANDPDTRFVQMRSEVDAQFREFFEWLRDRLTEESPEVRAAARRWIETRPYFEVDLPTDLMQKALVRIDNAEALERAIGPGNHAIAA